MYADFCMLFGVLLYVVLMCVMVDDFEGGGLVVEVFGDWLVLLL